MKEGPERSGAPGLPARKYFEGYATDKGYAYAPAVAGKSD